MSSLVHLVTQLMSTVYVCLGSARNWSQVQCPGVPTRPSMVRLHWSSLVRGVGPADSTGKSLTRYCPGGTRLARSASRRFPKKPRDTKWSPIDLEYSHGQH